MPSSYTTPSAHGRVGSGLAPTRAETMARHYLDLSEGNPSVALRMLAVDRVLDLDRRKPGRRRRSVEPDDARG